MSANKPGKTTFSQNKYHLIVRVTHDRKQMTLDERKIIILKAIIRSYMENGEPVGSRTLSKLPDLTVSSATIRNEMSDLEEMGYIIQPHTSAGRIPTDKGYRFYVDELMKEKENAVAAKDTELTQYKDLMTARMDRLEYVLKHVAKLLAANTNYAAMISGPSSRKNKIKFIQLSRMEAHKLLVATVFEGNIINNRIIRTEEELSDGHIADLNMLLNTSLTGLTMDEINLATITKLRTDAGEYTDVIDKVLNEISDAFAANEEDEELEIYTSGATNIFKYPELTEGDTAGTIIDQFEKKDEIRRMLNDMNENAAARQRNGGTSTDSLRVYIGEELPMHDLSDCSLVTANYDFGGGLSGTIGIVGPKRMNYDKVLGTLQSVMTQLEEAFKEK